MAKRTIRKQTSERRASGDSGTVTTVSEEYTVEESVEAGSPVVTESYEVSVKESAASPEDVKEKKGFFEELKDKNNLIKMAVYGIGVLISALIAFYIRILPKDGVFMENGFIRFGENDPWYHWRNVDYLLHNFPSYLQFDPATTYPYGTPQAFAPLYDYILVAAIKIMQMLTGNTSTEFAMTIAAYWPCVLAAVCVVIMYFVAKKFFNSRNIGLLSAFLLAIAPGQFLSRSIIGFSDHHVAEVLFSSLVILFLTITLIKAFNKHFTFDELMKGKFSVFKSILPYAVLTGVFMAAYTLVWEGALLFAFIIGVYITIQMLINHLRGEGTALIASIGIIVFAIDLLIVLLVPQIGEYKFLHMIALGAGIIAMIIMAVLSYVLEKKNMNRLYFPGVLAGLVVVGAIAGSLISSTVRNMLISVVSFFTRTGGATTIGEASPFFGSSINPLFFTALIALFLLALVIMAVPSVNSTIKKGILAVWPILFLLLVLFSGEFVYLFETFSVMGYIWIIALPILAYVAVSNNNMEKTLLVIWTVVLLWAMVQQNRFSYYFIVPIVILTSWVFMRVLYIAGIEEAWASMKKNYLSKESRAPKKEEPVVYSSKQERAKSKRDTSKVKVKADNGKRKIAIVALVLILALSVLIIPTVARTSLYTQGTGGPNEAWIETTLWVRDNTPEIGLDWYGAYEEPLQDADGDGVADSSGLGIEYFENQASVVPFDYPGEAYGILSWWDYGHWLEVIGERMVNANPFQFGVGGRRGNVTDDMIPGAAPFFVAESEAEATGYLIDIDPREDKVGARYIVTDIEMASGMSKFYAMTAWTLDTDDYRVTYNINGQDMTFIGSDRYFNSMVYRLHMLDAVGMEQYRMVYESLAYSSTASMSTQEIFYKQLFNQLYSQSVIENNTGYVKVFEYVEGAVITGEASPNETVNLTLTVQTNQNRVFNYRQSVQADASGVYSFTVPYSTTGPIDGETNFAVKPIGNYTVTTSAGERSINVSEEDVLNGNTVQVTAL